MKVLPIGIIVIVALVVLYFVMSGRSSNAPAPKAAAPTAAAPAGAPAATTPAEAALPELTPQQLLKEASTAMHENRLVAPAGNNAYEYYERLLEKDPNNQTAKDALRETFPIVIGVPEQYINAGNVDEATRVINLLAKADPNNYTLTILRGKLDAKKKQNERELAQQTAAAAAAAAKTAQAPANNAAAAAAAAAAASRRRPVRRTGPPSAAGDADDGQPLGQQPRRDGAAQRSRRADDDRYLVAAHGRPPRPRRPDLQAGSPALTGPAPSAPARRPRPGR